MVLPCLMTALNRIGGSCFEWVGDRIQTETSHLIAYGDNLENLRTKVQDLSDAIEAVEHRIEEAANRGATLVAPIVGTLLKRMASLREEASKIIVDEEQSSDSKCLMGLRVNLWACYLISKSSRKAIDEATELLEKEKKLNMPVASIDFSESLGVKPISEFEEFESRVLVSNQIMAALKDPSVNMVGVYGMGGAGKTTLAEKIGADLQLDSTFRYVVLTTVSEKQDQFNNNYKPNLLNIQKQIAEGFKIQLQSETLRNRAAELDKQLQKKDKVLIIFDDIWSGFELKNVGIPIDNVDKKFKILMTSRSEVVLLKEMNSRNNFGLDSLPHPDACILFDRMVGGHSEYSKWRPTAMQVVEQCGGIPIVLVTIARALRNEASEFWEDALTQLKKFDGKDIVKEPYKMIEVSYKFLKNQELQKLLILCAQLNHRAIAKDDLLKYAMGLNLFEGCKTLKEVSNKLHRYLSELKGCCLLQDSNKEGMIKMHDVVHKFATFVGAKDHHVFNVANDGELEDWPSKDELEHFSAISLPFCHLPPDHMLPAAFDNPKLESFLMLRSEIDASFQISDNFFAGMKELKLMDLSNMSLSSVLVSSFEVLVKLRTLCLDGCHLSDISVIGELPRLQVLSLVGSSIVLIPKEIGKLGSTLKLLDLRYCEKLERIAAGVIFRLTLLEDLRIGDSSMTWHRLEGSHNIVEEMNEAEMASMEEFKNLRNLIDVEIHISDYAKMFPKDLVFKKLQTFKICFGSNGKWLSSKYISTRTLQVNGSTIVEFDGEGINALLASVESLLLGGVMCSVTVSEMDQKGFRELKHLKVDSAEGIQYIVKKNYNTCIFPKLETLKLFGLIKLERICDDHVLPVGSFENLRVINVSRCRSLNHLFSSNLTRGLLRLKEIKVKSCKTMESVIVSRERESEYEERIQIGFTHQLQVLKLTKLPRLVSFCSFKQLEELPSPTPFFNKKIIFPNLVELILYKMKIEKIWDDYLAITIEGTCWLQNLTRLEVSYCHSLRYLFTSSMVQSLEQLKQLDVTSCESIEEIVASTAENVQLLFPKLDKIELEDLPNLKRFCEANVLECPLLRKFVIKDCLELKTFISANDDSTNLFTKKVAFPNMEELKIVDCPSLTSIFPASLVLTTLQQLKRLEVSHCENLSYVFTSSMVKSLEKLNQFEVSNCESIEEIVVSTTEDVQLLFPKLDMIELEDLPNLERFCEANLLECQSLRKLVIRVCPKLKTFMSANDSSSSDNSTTMKVAFPNMEELKIADCPSLTSIFPASLVPTTLQQLKRFEVQNCFKIDLFGFNNTQQQLNDAFVKLIFSLKYCYIDIGGGLKLRYVNQQFKLDIVGCGFQIPPILFDLLKSFPKLNEVEVSGYSIITQLFPCELNHLATVTDGDGDDMGSQADTLALIGCLRLIELSNMKRIWSEHSPLKYHVIPEALKVVDCDSLLSLAPPSPTLFKNLTVLLVRGCPMLIRLVTSSSTAKSLVNLIAMTVIQCDSLEEIVGIDDPRDELASNGEYVVFDKLESLYLRDLNRFTSFCSTFDCNFRLPSLNRVIVINCPNMKFFSKGSLSTPNLIRVVVEDENEDEGRWEGDLNSTIQQLSEELVMKMEKKKKENKKKKKNKNKKKEEL